MPIKLVLKELRETIWIAAAALVVYMCFVSSAMGTNLAPWYPTGPGQWVPFVGDEFLSSFAVVAACLAIGLGLRQSAWESVQGTYLLLLHRPAGRQRLIGTKLLVGGGLYLVCSAVPILIYAWWAATPGTHPGPFEWSMTFPAWKVWGTTTILYLGAFLGGIRPARWYGTRLLPLAATGGLAAAIPWMPWWSICGLPLVVVLDALLVLNVFFVARTRDF